MSTHKSTSSISYELFKDGVTNKDLKGILECGKWIQYKQIIDMEKASSIPMKKLNRIFSELERKRLVGEEFKATVKEMRRTEKARAASKKHLNKNAFQSATLDIDIITATMMRNDLQEEKESLIREIHYYKCFLEWPQYQ